MPQCKRPELFSPEANALVQERFRTVSAEELQEWINWRPEGVTDDWPSLIEQPVDAQERNGASSSAAHGFDSKPS